MLSLLASVSWSPAFAQCQTDMDCKGDRICEHSACVDPAPVTAPVPRASATATDLVEIRAARSKAVTAFVGSGAGFLLGAASAAANGSGPPAYMLGTGSLLSFGITAPVGASGANQARRLAAVRGLRAPGRSLQVVSWIGYGLTMVNGGALITLGVLDEDVPTAAIVSTVLLGASSTIGMGIDALNGASVVEGQLQGGGAVTRRRRVRWTPVASVGERGALVGLHGTF